MSKLAIGSITDTMTMATDRKNSVNHVCMSLGIGITHAIAYKPALSSQLHSFFALPNYIAGGLLFQKCMAVVAKTGVIIRIYSNHPRALPWFVS